MKYQLPETIIHDSFRSIQSSERYGWALEHYGVLDLHKQGFTGKGVNLYIVDTGCNYHEDLKIAGGFDAVNGQLYDDNTSGHGTHVTGIAAAQNNDVGIIGIAPNATVWIVKVFGGTFADGNDIIKGLQWIIDHDVKGRKVVNMSYGSMSYWGREARMMQKLDDAGIFCFAAGGNNGKDTDDVMFPARCPTVNAIASHGWSWKISEFSNRGENINVAAYGENVLSANARGGYVRMTGTSTACPTVSGIACLMIEANPLLTTAQMRDIINTTAIDTEEKGKDLDSGFGIIDAKACIEAANKYSNNNHFTAIELASRWNTNSRALMKKYAVDLVDMCIDLGLNPKGKKKTLVSRISAAIKQYENRN